MNIFPLTCLRFFSLSVCFPQSLAVLSGAVVSGVGDICGVCVLAIVVSASHYAPFRSPLLATARAQV